MTAKKAPIGEQYIRAQAAFEKKYANNPELIKEVKALTDLLQIWHIHVMLTVWTEIIKKNLDAT